MRAREGGIELESLFGRGIRLGEDVIEVTSIARNCRIGPASL